MKFSKHAHMIEGPKGIILYNSINGEKLKISKEDYYAVTSILDEEDDQSARLKLEGLIDKGLVVDVEEETDYYTRPSQEMMDKICGGVHISNLRLNLTHDCNLRCKYCFENGAEQYMRHQTMEFDVAKKAIDVFISILTKNNRERGAVRFFGGEPLINYKLLCRLVDYISQTKPENLDIELLINTNGTLVNEEIAKFLKKNSIRVIVSLDGIGKINDEQRVDIRGNGSFIRVDNGLRTLAKEGCDVDVATVVTSTNVDYLTDLIDYIHEMNLEFNANYGIAFSHVQIKGEKEPIEAEVKVRKIINAIRIARQKGINCYGGFTHQVFMNMLQPNGGRHCVCMGTELSVMPDGSIYPCDGLKIQLGSIFDIDKLLNGDDYLNLVTRTCGYEKSCRGCEIEYYCAGGCYADFLSDDGKKANSCRNRKYQVLLFKELVKEYLLS